MATLIVLAVLALLLLGPWLIIRHHDRISNVWPLNRTPRRLTVRQVGRVGAGQVLGTAIAVGIIAIIGRPIRVGDLVVILGTMVVLTMLLALGLRGERTPQ